MVSTGQIPLASQTVRLPAVATVETPSREPRWVSHHFVYKVVASYLRTAWAFAREPYESGRAWANGDLHTANPGDVLFQIMAVLGPWYAFTAHLFNEPATVWTSVRHAKTALVGVFAIGTLIHVGFRLVGSKRRLTTSWGAAILALGGLPVPVLIVLRPLSLWAAHHLSGPAAQLVPVGLSLLGVPLVFGQVAITLAGVHQRSRATAIGLMAAAIVIAGIAMARLDPVVTPLAERGVHWLHALTG